MTAPEIDSEGWTKHEGRYERVLIMGPESRLLASITLHGGVAFKAHIHLVEDQYTSAGTKFFASKTLLWESSKVSGVYAAFLLAEEQLPVLESALRLGGKIS